MKTAKEKAREWLQSNIMDNPATAIDVDFLERQLEVLLKEQDRDTRHACAEAVNRMALDHAAITQAHNTVMNTKAV